MRYWLNLFLIVMLSGCAPLWETKPAQDPEQLWQERQKQQASLDTWAFKGRTAIIQGREGWNAGIRWLKQGQQFYIKLSGPFSQGGVTLDGNHESVTLTLDDGEQLSAATPEQLLAEAMGWLLPVSALSDWVRGVPYAQLPVDSRELDAQGRLTTLAQAGWNIEFLGYMPFQGSSMPKKVFMKNSQMSVRLIVTDWSIPE